MVATKFVAAGIFVSQGISFWDGYDAGVDLATVLYVYLSVLLSTHLMPLTILFAEFILILFLDLIPSWLIGACRYVRLWGRAINP